MKKLFLLLFPLWLQAQQIPISQVPPNQFVFTLPYYRPVVDAYIYDATGKLVRTVFQNKPFAKGKHSFIWDGKDDDSVVMPRATYTWKVCSDSIIYTWNGTYGNNSTNQTGPTKWRGFKAISDMCEVGSYIYAAQQFSEGEPGVRKFLESAPNQQINFLPFGFTMQGTQFICADNHNIYFGGNDYNNAHNFVYGSPISNDATYVAFSAGVLMHPGQGIDYTHAIDMNTSASGAVTGMAVQYAGNYLYVSHAGLNKISILTTTTGATLSSLALTAPGRMAIENDTTLIVCQPTAVTKYHINTDGSLTQTMRLTGFTRASAVAVKSGVMNILDGVIKRYNSTTGASTGTFGSGGYATDPTVTNTKWFLESSDTVLPNYLTFQSDGSYWVGDPGNNRNQHFNSSDTYLGTIMYQDRTYNVNCALNNNTAVFSKTLEFLIDYAQPNDLSWTLVKNWGYNYLSTYDHTAIFGGVILMGNGRRYTIIRGPSLDFHWAELSTTGLRVNATPIVSGVPASMGNDGNVYTFSRSANNNATVTWKRYTVTGYSGSNFPVMSAPVTASAMFIGNQYPLARLPNYCVTTSGKQVVFDVNYDATRLGLNGNLPIYHFAGYNLSTNSFDWKNRKEDVRSYNGPYPTDGTFDIGNTVVNPGGNINVIGNDVFLNDRDELWKQNEGSYMYHFNDQGMFLGLFGTNTIYANIVGQAAPGISTNTENVSVTQVGGTYKFFNNDESRHSGIGVWTASNLSSVAIQSASFTMDVRSFRPPTATINDLLTVFPSFYTPVNGVFGITRFPLLNNSVASPGNPIFTAVTRRGTYQGSADIFVVSNGQSASGVVKNKLLVAVNSRTSLNTWTLYTELNLNKSFTSDPVNANSTTGIVFKLVLLDNAGKEIANLMTRRDNGGTLLFNDQAVVTGAINRLSPADDHVKVSITYKGGMLYLALNGYNVAATATKSVYDGTANIRNPSQFGCSFQHNVAGKSAQYDIISLKFQGN